MSELSTPVVVTGTLDRSVYRSLKKYIMPTTFKVILLVVMAAYNGWLLYQLIREQSLGYLVFMVVFTGLMIWWYRRNQETLVKRAIASNKEVSEGDGLLLTLTLGQTGLTLLNNTMNRERNLPYAQFRSMVETDKCIALFVKGGNYLMIPKDHMDDKLHDAVLERIHHYCPGLHRRW